MTVKRSSREGLWADLPSARVRFAIEAAFLLLVAAGAALAKLSPLRIILLMFLAWVLVALIEGASSRAKTRSLRTSGGPVVAAAAHEELAPAPDPVPEPQPELSELDAEVTELLAAPESIAPGPVVTKRALELQGLEQTEPPPPAPPQPKPVQEAPTPPARTPAPREWNLWELERRARDYAGEAARDEEWTALFVHLRQFADTGGQLPEEFDGLVRESFAELIQAA